MSGDDSGHHSPGSDVEGYKIACLMRDVENAPDPQRAVSLICSGATQFWPVSACWMVLPRQDLRELIAFSGFADLSAETLRRAFDSGAPACLQNGGIPAEPVALADETPDGCGDCSLAAHCGAGPRAVIPLGGSKGHPGLALLLATEPVEPPLLEAASTILRWLTSSLASRAEHERVLSDLIQAQKMEAVGRLASGVSHDFNNLLAAILVCTDMLLGELSVDNWVHEEVTVIQKAARSAADLTKKLLVFGSTQPLQVEPFELGRLVAESIPMLCRAIPEHIVVEHRRAPVSLPIEADRNQIEQVLVNLVQNARDAMPEGGKLVVETVSVQVDGTPSRVSQNLSPGAYAALVVTDDGVGMDPQTQARIFDPFFTTKSRGQGAGLGLSSVFGIVKTHQGNVVVDSRLGEGSRVTVHLPSREQDVELEPAIDMAVTTPGDGERVLLVEDDDMMRRVANLLLVRLGYQVHLASDGHEAIALLDELDDKPQLIITDMSMPNMSGSEFVTRALARHPDMKVLFMTGQSDLQSEGLAPEHREFRVVQKPFNLAEFSVLVREVLQA